MASEKKIIEDLVYHQIQKANSKRVLDKMFKLMKANGEFKNFGYFQRWIIAECCKTVPILNKYIQDKYKKQ